MGISTNQSSSGLGFLWFNTYPAEVFMGDVGSLGLGAALGTMAVIIRQEIILCIMGGIFVLEMDMIQYSLAEITRIIESNKSMVLSVATAEVEDVFDKIAVTIKVNTLDLTYILASFERYNYNITHVYHHAEQIDHLKDRYDSFMNYINI